MTSSAKVSDREIAGRIEACVAGMVDMALGLQLSDSEIKQLVPVMYARCSHHMNDAKYQAIIEKKINENLKQGSKEAKNI